MSSLKLLFLIAVLFNCKIMQFLLIGFHSVGKALKFTGWCHFSGLAYKANTRLFSASAYYRDNWINNAAIIVCVCWYGCQRCVCVS